jgi:hypothetical protein
LKDNNFTFSDDDEGIKVKFRPYSEIIENLTNSYVVETPNDEEEGEKDLIIECMLSKDEHSLIIILKRSDEKYLLRVLCAGTFRKSLEIPLEGDYIKAAKIVQNFNGTVYCVPYLRNGKFWLLTFNTTKEIDNVNLSQKFGIAQYIRPNDNLEFPMMDACFVDSRNIQGENLILSSRQRIEGERIYVNMYIPKAF